MNAQGSSQAEVLGIDYKTTLKPMLTSFQDEMKNSSMMKMEELITLQQQSVEKASKIESKRNRLTTLQGHIDNVSVSLLQLWSTSVSFPLVHMYVSLRS